MPAFMSKMPGPCRRPASRRIGIGRSDPPARLCRSGRAAAPDDRRARTRRGGDRPHSRVAARSTRPPIAPSRAANSSPAAVDRGLVGARRLEAAERFGSLDDQSDWLSHHVANAERSLCGMCSYNEFVILVAMLALAMMTQQPVRPFPKPGETPPPAPAPQPPTRPAPVAPQKPVTAPSETAPTQETLGLPVYPGAQFLASATPAAVSATTSSEPTRPLPKSLPTRPT